jgi:IS1 family transposase
VNKELLYLVTFVDRASRCIVSWDLVTERTFETMQDFADQVWQHSPLPCHSPACLFYSDQLSTYSTLVYRQGQHQPQPGKSQTYTVEGLNADLRCYVSTLVRRTRGFARDTQSLRRMVWLFVFCHNRRCLALQRAWARLWPPLQAHCSAGPDEVEKQRLRLRHRLLYRFPLISFLPALF